uniref:Glutathione S-transferase GSTe9 n=1 Tax=Dendroctonus armandi TaxID=77159 RepID=A0A5P9JPL4_9CUCU|nr:glutathione S-transferase GSTe9 [Dendroctonus armandi]
MAPKLYYMAASPPCRAVLMVAKAIGLELELEAVEFEQLRTEEILELNPQHTVPILVDADEDFTIWDSHAIAIYLVGQYASDDSLYPKNDIKQVAVINQRMQFDNILFDKCKAAFHPIMMGIEDVVSEEASDCMLESLGLLEVFLKDKPWIAGDVLTIADLTILALVATVEEVVFPIDPERFPKLSEWFNKAKELAYFEECNKEGLDKMGQLVRHEVPLI